MTDIPNPFKEKRQKQDEFRDGVIAYHKSLPIVVDDVELGEFIDGTVMARTQKSTALLDAVKTTLSDIASGLPAAQAAELKLQIEAIDFSIAGFQYALRYSNCHTHGLSKYAGKNTIYWHNK